MSTTVTQKGQVTIPKPVRDRLGITPGSRVEFGLAEDGRVVLTKVDSVPGTVPDLDFSRFLGCAGPGMSTDEIMALMRDPL